MASIAEWHHQGDYSIMKQSNRCGLIDISDKDLCRVYKNHIVRVDTRNKSLVMFRDSMEMASFDMCHLSWWMAVYALPRFQNLG